MPETNIEFIGLNDGQTVEVALHHRGARHRAAQLATAEHVGEAAAPARVEQDQEDEGERDDDLDDDQDRVDHDA